MTSGSPSFAKDASDAVLNFEGMQEHFPLCRTYYDGCNCDDTTWEFVAGLTAEAADLRKALTDALDGMEDMITYVPEYFRDKWEHDGFIERARQALAPNAEAEPRSSEPPLT